jgi:branched-chain amino acid transport system substrate-binding protein
MMNKRHLIALTAASLMGWGVSVAHAQDNTFKVGLLLPMTGPFASTGKQMEAGARLYLAQNGSTVAGKKIELILKRWWSTKKSMCWRALA